MLFKTLQEVLLDSRSSSAGRSEICLTQSSCKIVSSLQKIWGKDTWRDICLFVSPKGAEEVAYLCANSAEEGVDDEAGKQTEEQHCKYLAKGRSTCLSWSGKTWVGSVIKLKAWTLRNASTSVPSMNEPNGIPCSIFKEKNRCLRIFFWSGHVSVSLWSNVSKFTSL